MSGSDIFDMCFQAAALGLISGMTLGAIKAFLHNLVN